jgi:hypothetical protein
MYGRLVSRLVMFATSTGFMCCGIASESYLSCARKKTHLRCIESETICTERQKVVAVRSQPASDVLSVRSETVV